MTRKLFGSKADTWVEGLSWAISKPSTEPHTRHTVQSMEIKKPTTHQSQSKDFIIDKMWHSWQNVKPIWARSRLVTWRCCSICLHRKRRLPFLSTSILYGRVATGRGQTLPYKLPRRPLAKRGFMTQKRLLWAQMGVSRLVIEGLWPK